MEQIKSSSLKTILHSKRANIYYLEYCKLLQKDGRVVYITESKKQNLYYNIPIANTTVILLGSGTSVTQSAVRMLSQAGVMLGFCGGNGTPLYAGNDIEWIMSHSEYRPTEYLQLWLNFWFDDNKRLIIAKELQKARINYLEKVTTKEKEFKLIDFHIENPEFIDCQTKFKNKIEESTSLKSLLGHEGCYTKSLYQILAKKLNIHGFKREHATASDSVNILLNHGNYLAYGLAATSLWALGIPHGLAVIHGKTRRGALVFDIADMIKDAIILPWAFVCAKENNTNQEFRNKVTQAFIEHKTLDYMFDHIKIFANFFKK